MINPSPSVWHSSLSITMLFLLLVIIGCEAGDGTTLNSLGEPLGPPKLDQNPSSMSVTVQKGTILPIEITIRNLGGFPLIIDTLMTPSDWLTSTATNFPHEIAAGDSAIYVVDIGKESLGGGIYDGQIIIISNNNDISESEYLISVQLTLSEEILAFEPIFSQIQSRIFNLYCTECHNSSNPPEGLDLTRDNAYANIFNVRSSQLPELFLVEPFAPDDAYLVQKMEGAISIVEDRMPLDEDPVSAAYISVLRAWISQGAQNN